MPEAILPMTLGYFTGTSTGTAVELNWRTMTEMKMHSFQIERSGNGIDFYNIGSRIANNFQNGSKYFVC
jgi:hypothetical protein